MKFLLSVITAADVIAPTEAVIDIPEGRAKTFLKRHLAYKAIDAYDKDLDEIAFWSNECDFVEVSEAYPTSIAEQLGREDETGPENEQYEVLPRLFEPRYQRARMDTGHLILDEYGMFFRAYPHHGEYLLTTGLIPWAEIEKVASGLEEREGHSIASVGAVCDHCVTDYERTEKSSPMPPGEFYLCARCGKTFDEPARASDEDAGSEDAGSEDVESVKGDPDDHGLGPVLLEKAARVWTVPFIAVLKLPLDQDDTVAIVRETWVEIFAHRDEVLDWGHDKDPEYVGYRLWRAHLCILLKSEETELRVVRAHALSLSTSGGKISPRSWLKLLGEEHNWIQSTLVLGEISEHELAAGYREGQMFVPTPREGFHVQGLPVCVTCLKPGEREAIRKEQAISPGPPFRCRECGVCCTVPKEGEGS